MSNSLDSVLSVLSQYSWTIWCVEKNRDSEVCFMTQDIVCGACKNHVPLKTSDMVGVEGSSVAILPPCSEPTRKWFPLDWVKVEIISVHCKLQSRRKWLIQRGMENNLITTCTLRVDSMCFLVISAFARLRWVKGEIYRVPTEVLLRNFVVQSLGTMLFGWWRELAIIYYVRIPFTLIVALFCLNNHRVKPANQSIDDR